MNMKSNYVGINEVGQFDVVSGAVEITDPCYAPKDGVILNKIRNGQYVAFTEIVDQGSWGGRNSLLYAVNKKYFEDNQLTKQSLANLAWIEHDLYFGVDSGQGGIFDTASYNGGEDEQFYNSCCNITLQGIGAGTVGFGAVSRSGYGDGGYAFETVYDNEEVVAIRLVFITEDEEEEDE